MLKFTQQQFLLHFFAPLDVFLSQQAKQPHKGDLQHDRKPPYHNLNIRYTWKISNTSKNGDDKPKKIENNLWRRVKAW